MQIHRLLWLPTLVVSLALAGCQSPPDRAVKIYDLKAKVVAVDVDKKTVTLDHEDIPGYMKAMEMPFAVESVKLLENTKPGDQVHGKLRVGADGPVIVELQKR